MAPIGGPEDAGSGVGVGEIVIEEEDNVPKLLELLLDEDVVELVVWTVTVIPAVTVLVLNTGGCSILE